MFTGERPILAGGRFLARIQAVPRVEVIGSAATRCSRSSGPTRVSDIFLVAPHPRRLQLIAHGFGDVLVLGSNHCRKRLHIPIFSRRRWASYKFLDLDSYPDSQAMLDQFHVKAGDIPVVICR